MKAIVRVVGAILVLFFLIVFGAAYRQTQKAKSLLRDVESLKVGVSSLSDVESLMRQYGQYRAVGSACRPESCDVQFVFYNKAIAYLMMARPLAFDAYLDVRDGKLSAITLVMVSVSPGHEEGVRLIQSTDYSAQVQDLLVEPIQGNRRILTNGESLTLKPEPSLASKERAYEFNVDCLASVLGCRSFRQMHSLATR